MLKKVLSMVSLVLVLTLMVAIGTAGATEYVDTYTSASLTKSKVEGEELAELSQKLSGWGADIATKAQTEEPGYVKMYNKHVQIMTVNPDGTVGLSTIGYWRYANNIGGQEPFVVKAGDWSFTSRGEGNDQVIIQLTYGQNALNLNKDDARATLLVRDEKTTYLLHLKLADRYEQVFDQAAYDAGEFASGYSGASNGFSSFYFIFDVMSIEKSSMLMFD